jgi:DNA-binding NarL/FixJ family response regulator
VRRTLLVVDDHANFRGRAREVLEGDAFTVIGEAATAREAVELARLLRPDVVVLDIALPDGSGFDVALALVPAVPRPDGVLVSSRDWSRLSGRVRRSGARGFLPKEELTSAAVEEMIA